MPEASRSRRLLGHNEGLDERLYRDLVASLYSTPKSIFAASVIAVVIVSIAQGVSGDPVYGAFLAAFALTGVLRVVGVTAFRARQVQTIPIAGLRRWELCALLGAWSFSALIGALASYATVAPSTTSVELLTSCGAIGYIAGISSRNASRPVITIGQISAICLPFAVSLCYRGELVHLTIAAFILCLFLSTIAMSRGMHENIVKRYQAHADLERAAHYDALTGLKNRTAFIAEIDRHLAAGASSLALIAIDLDDFKDVNDGLGHLAGDAVLKEAAARIAAGIEGPHEISRIGGDEFLVALPGADWEGARRVARLLGDALAAEIRIDGRSVSCGASLGVAVGPEDGRTYNELMSSADLALYAAKAAGRRQVVEYAREHRAAFDERRALERDLKEALARSELELVYQPVVDGRSRMAVSCEALLRWRHPVRGAVPPATFIPVAEATGLIVPIGAWVLRAACAEAMSWPPHVRVAVNLSAIQFQRGRELIETVREALRESGLPAQRLELEITETVLIENTGAARAIVEELRAEGVGVALDDFGTGFSSLAYLNDVPFSKLKVDQKFSRSVCESERTRSIVRSIRQLTADLGIDLVAEGIETEEQLASLGELGLHDIQGYVFSRPLSAQHLRDVLPQPFVIRRAPAQQQGASASPAGLYARTA